MSKEEVVEQVEAHQCADEIVQGYYWENGKGCAVGCIIHGGDHSRFENLLGWPWQVAWLMDDIFELLPNDQAKLFPLECVKAVKVGADLSKIYDEWCVWMLSDPHWGLTSISVEPSVKMMAELFVRAVAGDEPTEVEWDEAARAARAAWDVWAVWAAWAARAARAARDVWDARAARAARAAWAARDDRDARYAFALACRDKFLELMKEARVGL